MKNTIGLILQFLGIFVVLFGVTLADKLGYPYFQIPLLISGIIISFIGFGMHLKAPPSTIVITHPEKPVETKIYKTLAEKNNEFARRQIGWFIPMSLYLIFCYYRGTMKMNPSLLLGFLIPIVPKIIQDYNEIYRTSNQEAV